MSRRNDSDSIKAKQDRLEAGAAPRVLDLFSGCGGMSLGFVRSGCQSIGGVELDPHAAASYAANFHAADERHARTRDIRRCDPHRLLGFLGHTQPEAAVDVLIGGPPCPTFTRVGRAKLREVHRHPRAHLHDPRAKLYLPYLRYVEALKPVALVMENVPDFLNWSGHNLAEVICDALEELDYECTYTLLNAASYGVPQMRERFVLVAIHTATGAKFRFPEPLCQVTFPSGYNGTRDVALKHLRSQSMLEPQPRFTPTPKGVGHMRTPVTASDAISDLPPISSHLDGSLRRGARRFDTPVPYRADVGASGYARLMRDWPGFPSSGQIWDHAIRSLSERDYRLFRLMKAGDDYPKAHALAVRLFDEEMRKGRYRSLGEDSDEWVALRRGYVPPYDHRKFPNKWRKMEPDDPARTLMAHLGKDSYSHIHPDSSQARVISVREAARLQSFPDGFVFKGTMNPALRQIGNAVPPMFAWAIAERLLDSIGASNPAIPPRWRAAVVSCTRQVASSRQQLGRGVPAHVVEAPA